MPTLMLLQIYKACLHVTILESTSMFNTMDQATMLCIGKNQNSTDDPPVLVICFLILLVKSSNNINQSISTL